MPSGDVYKVTLDLALDAVKCRPGFYLVEGGGGAGPDPMANVGDAVDAAFGATALAGFVQNLTLSGYFIEQVQGAGLASIHYAITPQSGTIADDNPPPPQDTMLIHMATGFKATTGNFASHGRMYMPGIYSTGQVSGFLTVTLQGALGTFISKITSPWVDDGTAYQLNVVSFTPASNPRTIRAVHPVTNVEGRNQVRSQRRRQAGVGI